jgi:hypothetical protein
MNRVSQIVCDTEMEGYNLLFNLMQLLSLLENEEAINNYYLNNKIEQHYAIIVLG